MKNFLLAALGYLAVTFPLAVIWHVGLFKDFYISVGYFGSGEPDFALGFLAILVQGAVMSFAYPRCNLHHHRLRDALGFSALCGVFLWSTHVIAFAAKQEIPHLLGFGAMESLYLALQFGLFGLVLRLVYRAHKKPA